RIVVNPEKMVISEARRSFTYLNLFGFPSDAVVINRILPDGIKDDYFRVWKEVQEKHTVVIEESFSPLPIFKIHLFENEVVGLDALRRLARACFGEEDPARVFYRGFTQEIAKEGRGYLLSVKLPFVEKGEISLAQKGDELNIHVGDYRRNVILPRMLAGLEAGSAGFEAGVLKIRFGGETDG
ncbi:MAG: ArsA family ATPase, partial [Candidatus Desulforudis sp.]|nr:ArsA family ATPase [Desulforudis sp.]